MKTIISARLTAKEGEPLNQFFRGANNTVKNKIIALIEKNPGAEFDFLVDEDGSKSIMFASDLVGEVINIVDDTCIAEFEEGEDDTIEISFSLFEGALPRKETIEQLKKLRKATKGIDIGDKISDMSKQGANISYIRNPVDTGVESIEDYWKSNTKFKPNKNLNIKKFKDFK